MYGVFQTPMQSVGGSSVFSRPVFTDMKSTRCGFSFIRKTAADCPSGSHMWLLILTATLPERNKGSFPGEETHLWEADTSCPKLPSRKRYARLGPLGPWTPETHSSNCMYYLLLSKAAAIFWVLLILI